MPRARLSDHQRRLESLAADYQAAKARLAEVGFTCEGSLVERYTSCHNLRSNGDFDVYWRWHRSRERQRVHEARRHENVIRAAA